MKNSRHTVQTPVPGVFTRCNYGLRSAEEEHNKLCGEDAEEHTQWIDRGIADGWSLSR